MSRNNASLIFAAIVPVENRPEDKKYLLVKTSDGKYGLPGGKIETFENIEDIALLIREETGLHVIFQDIVGGLYEYSEGKHHFLKTVFSARLIEREPILKNPSDREIVELHYKEIEYLYEAGKLNAGRATFNPIRDYANGQRLPLGLIRHLGHLSSQPFQRP